MKQERDAQKRKKTDETERQGNTGGQKANRRQGQPGSQGDQPGQQDNRRPSPRPSDFDEEQEDRTDQRRRA